MSLERQSKSTPHINGTTLPVFNMCWTFRWTLVLRMLQVPVPKSDSTAYQLLSKRFPSGISLLSSGLTHK